MRTFLLGVQKHSVFLLASLLLTNACTAPEPHKPAPDLRYVTSIGQAGPVAYRDPFGVVSPDGSLFAYSNDRLIDVIAVEGGAVRKLGRGRSDIRFVTWMGNSAELAVQERLFDRSAVEWHKYTLDGRRPEPLWPEHPESGLANELSWSADGTSVVGAIRIGGTSRVVRLDPKTGAELGIVATGNRLSFPTFMPDGRVACLSLHEHGQNLQEPCGEPSSWEPEVYGRLAYSHDGLSLYYGSPDDRGRLDLWVRRSDGQTTKLTSFDRDAYSPSVSAAGTVVFKLQDYRLFIATAPAEGGETRQVTTFLSETPMWDWSGTRLSFTWGDWRRQTDDIHYPDISQHIGWVDMAAGLPAKEPSFVFRESHSEDQAMHWSPNEKWIVFHTHVNGDDIWLAPADGSAPPRQITEGGSETGWPRWSPDGRWILYPSFTHLPEGGRRSDLYLIGVDQESGLVTSGPDIIVLENFGDGALQGDWLGGSEEVLFETAYGAGKKGLYRVPRVGGEPTLIHRYDSPQVYSGISASPDGRWIAFVAPTPSGWLQIHRVPSTGGQQMPLTHDASNKTQPAYSPDGEAIAFTVFSYQVHFWALGPE